MTRVIALLGLLCLAGCATTATNDWTRFADGSLTEWLDREAVPGLTKTLTEHPRFKAETIRIAALAGEQVAGRSNGLTTAVRETLHSALLQKPGLNIMQLDGPQKCTMAPIDGYYLAVAVSASGKRGAKVQLRLFDTVEQQWVSGFGYQWHGDLTSAERDALHRPVVAESARGLRVLPFTGDQSDLLAERLAADLACQLQRDGNDELIVQPARDRAAALIAGNLAGKHQIPVAADGALELETRVHQVDEKLYQVWAILTPKSASAELSAITTSAYATRPLLKPATTAKTPSVSPVAAGAPATVRAAKIDLLSRLSVFGATGAGSCTDNLWRHPTRNLGDRPVIAPGGCFGLEFERRPDTKIYLISHRVDARLLRLYPSGCGRDRLDSRDAVIRFPQHSHALIWDARSGTETYYVIAARGPRATTRLDRLMTRLPDGCGAGVDGKPADPRWLSDIDSAVRALGDDVAWEAVRVYHQPRADAQRLGEMTGARR